MKLIGILHTIIFLLRSCKAQFYHEISQSSQLEIDLEYRKDQEFYIAQPNNRRYNYDSGERERCKCSCKKCFSKPKRCCKSICNKCPKPQPPSENLHPNPFHEPPSNLLLIPYPVPFLVPPSLPKPFTNRPISFPQPITNITQSNPSELTPTVSTNAQKTSSTIYFLDPDPNREKLKFVKHTCPPLKVCNTVGALGYKYQSQKSYGALSTWKLYQKMKPTATYGRTSNLEVTTEKRLPKYGLIVIPDEVAEKIMQQLKYT